MSGSLAGKIVVVTGAATGLGQAFAEAGADVATIDLGDVGDTERGVTGTGRRFAPHRGGHLRCRRGGALCRARP